MNPDDELEEQEWIDRYIANQLSETERQQFEEKLQEDSSLVMKVESTRQLMRMIRTANAEKRAQETLRKLYQQQPAVSKRLPVVYRWMMGAAAACIIMLLYLANTKAELPIIEDDLLVVKNADSTTSHDSSTYHLLMAGQKALQSGNYLQAANKLEMVLKTKDMRSYFREAAEWSLLAAYLYSNQPRRAEIVYHRLRQIDNPEYEIGMLERCKIYIQIQVRKW
ncbi:hypothetical protein GCM10028807_23740 [Spirosoma daeguense]